MRNVVFGGKTNSYNTGSIVLRKIERFSLQWFLLSVVELLRLTFNFSVVNVGIFYYTHTICYSIHWWILLHFAVEITISFDSLPPSTIRKELQLHTFLIKIFTESHLQKCHFMILRTHRKSSFPLYPAIVMVIPNKSMW